jgi:hypothetical protein
VTRSSIVAVVFSIVGGGALAQPANEAIKGLESCFQAARLADAICSNSANGPVQRLDCFQKARAAQLECLENVSSGMAAGSALPEHPSGTVPTAAPTAASPDLPKDTESPEKSVQTLLPEKPSGAISSGEPTNSSPVAPGPVLRMAPAVTSLPDLPTGAISEDMSAKPVGVPAKPPAPPDWVVSETTSPVDFSPIITVTIRSKPSVRDASDILTVRCRGKRTELLVRSEPGRAADAGEVQVAYQINDQSPVRLAWTASADGKTVSYKEDAAGFLQSLPAGAKLKISLPDKSGPGHEATFQLIGWDVIREKLKTACKWSPIADKLSSRKR